MEAFTQETELEDAGTTCTTGNSVSEPQSTSQQDTSSLSCTTTTTTRSGRDGAGSADGDTQRTHTDDIDVIPAGHDTRPLPTSHQQFYEAPEFTERLNVFEEVEQGGRVTFQCQVRACPDAVVKWFKDDVEITSDYEPGRVTADQLPSDSGANGAVERLCISDARKSDEGAYRCKAENKEGVAATTGYLSVTAISPTASPARGNGVSSVPLLRAITEHQSQEDREASLAPATVPSLQSTSDARTRTFSDNDALMCDEVTSLQDDTWTYLDYMKAAGIEPTQSPMDIMSSDKDLADKDISLDVFRDSSTPLAVPQSTEPSSDALGHSGRDTESLASVNVNVFVVESKDTDSSRDGGTSPLLIHDEPTVPQADRETTREDDVTGPVSFQLDVEKPCPADDVVAGEVENLSKESVTAVVPDMEQPGHNLVPEVTSVSTTTTRPVVELTLDMIGEYYMSWFELPWLGYVTVVVLATVLSLYAETDTALLLLVVVVATVTFFSLFPADDNKTS